MKTNRAKINEKMAMVKADGGVHYRDNWKDLSLAEYLDGIEDGRFDINTKFERDLDLNLKNQLKRLDIQKLQTIKDYERSGRDIPYGKTFLEDYVDCHLNKPDYYLNKFLLEYLSLETDNKLNDSYNSKNILTYIGNCIDEEKAIDIILSSTVLSDLSKLKIIAIRYEREINDLNSLLLPENSDILKGDISPLIEEMVKKNDYESIEKLFNEGDLCPENIWSTKRIPEGVKGYMGFVLNWSSDIAFDPHIYTMFENLLKHHNSILERSYHPETEEWLSEEVKNILIKLAEEYDYDDRVVYQLNHLLVKYCREYTRSVEDYERSLIDEVGFKPKTMVIENN